MVIAEDLFRAVLFRERKRAERFDQPFVLHLVAAKNRRAFDSATLSTLVEAISSVKRDTDVLGWYIEGSVLALIAPDIDGEDGCDLEGRLRTALARGADADKAEFHVECQRQAFPSGAGGASGILRDEKHASMHARVQSALKRALDVFGSAALLVLSSPLFIVVAALLKLRSPGPVFFSQERVGQYGKPFTMLKFRTMHVHADDAIHKAFVSQLIDGNASATEGGDAPFKIVHDPRVTAVGHFLRRSSLDELPQLWNVLTGEMCLVGPRPPLQYEVEQYRPWHYRRVLEAKPGMTGLWQVTGRSRTTFDEMVRLDLRYAQNPSVWTDIKILLATPKAVFSGKGAC